MNNQPQRLLTAVVLSLITAAFWLLPGFTSGISQTALLPVFSANESRSN